MPHVEMVTDTQIKIKHRCQKNTLDNIKAIFFYTVHGVLKQFSRLSKKSEGLDETSHITAHHIIPVLILLLPTNSATNFL